MSPNVPIGFSIHKARLSFQVRSYPLIPNLFLLPLVCLFLGGCATGYVRDYQPNTSAEEGIKETLIAFETAWNNHNEEALLALLDEDFIMWVWRGGTRSIAFRKGTFGFRLWEVFIRLRYLSVGEPSIGIKGDEATAYVPFSVDGRGHQGTFRFVNRDGKWLILEWEFY
jgi:hypothetical protein